MNHLISTISILAAVVSISGIVPQLTVMRKTRSSSGQSTLGWGLGAMTNSALAFVNLIGYHAYVLAAGNLVSLTGCLAAMYLIGRYRASATDADLGIVSDLRTQEFAVLTEAVLVEHHRRTGERELALCDAVA